MRDSSRENDPASLSDQWHQGSVDNEAEREDEGRRKQGLGNNKHQTTNNKQQGGNEPGREKRDELTENFNNHRHHPRIRAAQERKGEIHLLMKDETGTGIPTNLKPRDIPQNSQKTPPPQNKCWTRTERRHPFLMKDETGTGISTNQKPRDTTENSKEVLYTIRKEKKRDGEGREEGREERIETQVESLKTTRSDYFEINCN